jgi:hypothetical protein
MAFAADTLGSTPYSVHGTVIELDHLRQVGQAGTGPMLDGEHHIVFPTADARVDLTITAHDTQPEVRKLGGRADPHGDAVYLPYADGYITSVVLPPPTAGGIEFFFTANMTGCKFYIDRCMGTDNLVVYHANVPEAGRADAEADEQTSDAVDRLEAAYRAAQNYYGSGTLQYITSVAKRRYFREPAAIERRKRLQGRLGYAGSVGGPAVQTQCTIVGVPSGSAWSFHFQTTGSIMYDRPKKGIAYKAVHWNYARKMWSEGVEHKSPVLVLEHHQFY